MTDAEFQEQLNIIRSVADYVMQTGDFSQADRIKHAWEAITVAGRFLEADNILQAESEHEMKEAIGKVDDNEYDQ